ncbi:DNA-directed RNA polymerase subunit [Plakobranchus ocellatus]|uniref:DNA-directed RNA polymerase subunit n=1 Tax=Plakobranchus ocellatus TaxID=259542 RepID=A0AAV4ALL5_9GAST|nr:DNA-directed RNA polymerase subunit [Plakobranchus ocellatus]
MAEGENTGSPEQTNAENGDATGMAVTPSYQNKNENTFLIDERESPKNLAKLYTAALAISWVSILFSLGSGIAAIVLSFSNRSESLFAYGLDALLDSLSSVAVVWRFMDSTDHAKSRIREYKACLVIGVLFLVSAFSLICRSILAIVTRTKIAKHVTLFIEISLTCGLVTLIIGLIKVYLGYRIGSRALYTDSIITLVGAATCFMALAGLELYLQNKGLWFLDSVFGMVCGVFLIFFGLRLLYQTIKNKPPE